MLCAENLVLAASSLAKLFLHHGRAKRVFAPVDCDATILGVASLTALCSYRPDVEVGRLLLRQWMARRWWWYTHLLCAGVAGGV